MRKLLGWLPVILFLVGMGLLTIPDILLRRSWNLLRRSTPLQRRQTETAWQFGWARAYRRFIHKLMGISMPITIDANVPTGRPCIIVANHRTVIDHLCMAEVLKRLGLTHVLWVVKDEMRSAPVVGGSCERAGYALVSRQGDASDKEAVRALARLAREDAASVAIYPEGTRHDGIPRIDKTYLMLRDPKRGGLQVLLDELPDYDVVFVCLNWRGLRGGKTIWDGDGLLGIHGSVTVWGLARVPGDTAENILDEGWTGMDRILAPPAKEFLRIVTQA